MEALFTFFFKYPPFFFSRGEFSFQQRLADGWFVFFVVGLLGVLFFIYRRQWIPLEKRRRWSLMIPRGIVLLILLLLAMQPSLVLSRMTPGENLLALLVDNSRSMAIRDNGSERGQKIRELLSRDDDFLPALEEKFYLYKFRFAERAERQESSLHLDWGGNQTNIAEGLKTVLGETGNLPLGGILLFSDGSDNSFGNLKEVLAEVKARKIPIHTVGLGPESMTRDIEMTNVRAPRMLLPESVARVRVTLRHSGFGGSRGLLEVREGSVLVQTKEVFFPRDSETVVIELKLTPQSEGIKIYQFTLVPLEEEEIRENNSRRAVVRVENLSVRILYVEGRPRWEYKFIRQALREERSIRLETVLRTALNKFYRQGIEDETTLAGGFPSQREELFAYHGIILGSVESSFFTYSQMEMIRDFVGRRGGGFLMLGGNLSFAAGKYQDTPIEEILPVWLRGSGDLAGIPTTPYVWGDGRFILSDYGRGHPALQLSLEEEDSSRKWSEMPELRDRNVVKGPKPGATVLAYGEFGNRDSEPLLIFQRYGRGQSLALLTGSSWRWQMLQDYQDESHETFWRQILGWLIRSAGDPIKVETEREIYSRKEPVRIRAEVSDGGFNPINDSRVKAIVTSPSGEVAELPLRWDTREEGVYRGQWEPLEDGLYEIGVEATGPGLAASSSRQATTSFLCVTGNREYFDAVQKKDFLRKIAQETGGDYYNISSVRRLPQEILYTPAQSSVVEVLDLWDMPINLLLLLALLIAEWLIRKRYGLV